MAVKVINFNCQENYQPVLFGSKHDPSKFLKKHLVRNDAGGIEIVEDGIVDLDKEVQSELKNAGLQNILKLQELRYGTLDNAIARAADKGIYADLSRIPTDVASQAEFVAKAQAAVAKLKAEYGLTDDDLKTISAERLVAIYEEKAKAAAAAGQTSQIGGNE